MKIGYARTSTADQSLDLQIDALLAEGVERRFIFTDQASGKKQDRPGLKEALALASKGDELIVWRLDRLGRSMSHLIKTVTDLDECGIGFRSITEAIETKSANGRLVFGVFAAFAAFEQELTSERVRAGLAAAKSRGKVGGRPKTIPPGILDAAETWINNGGASLRKAADMFGVDRSTLSRELAARKAANGAQA